MGSSSPNFGIILFSLITITYFIIQYITKEQYNSAFLIYAIVIFLFQLGINLRLTSTLCGEVHPQEAFIYTLLPWALIFGLMKLMLLMFPGWLRPFSNTFGYLVVWIKGINNLLSNILKSPEKTSDEKFSKTLGKIYDDPSLLINEIPDYNIGFEEFWKKSSSGGIFSSKANEYKEKLRDMVRLKMITSKFLWFLLTGILTISTSYNYLIKSACNTSVKEMERRHNEYQQMVKEQSENTVNNERVYKDLGH